jgi:hypothetical protein
MVAQLGLWVIDGMYLQQYFRYRYIGNIAVSFPLVEKTGVPGDICHLSRKINNLPQMVRYTQNKVIGFESDLQHISDFLPLVL